MSDFKSDFEKVKESAKLLNAENNGESAFVALIDDCDKETVERLISFFDAGAPVQALLENKLKEFDSDSKTAIGNNLDEFKELAKPKLDFYQYLVKVMSEKGFESDADFYNHIGMSRQTFAKLRKPGATVSRNYVLLMAVGLSLDYAEAVEFMGNAGFVFKAYDNREAIISYIMRNKKYTLMEVEDVLYSMGEKPLMDS